MTSRYAALYALFEDKNAYPWMKEISYDWRSSFPHPSDKFLYHEDGEFVFNLSFYVDSLCADVTIKTTARGSYNAAQELAADRCLKAYKKFIPKRKQC